MKKTININLGGRLFIITDEAYTQLDNYIESIKKCVEPDEYGNEIVEDIEARISELCEERTMGDSNRIIDLAFINEVIKRIGTPEAMLDGEEGSTTPSGNETGKAEEKKEDGENKKRGDKKFFLNPDDRMLGGVCAGIATYFKLSTTLVRIIAVLLTILTGFWIWSIAAYLIIWYIAPVATTAADKLRMEGITPTPESIAEKIATEEPSSNKTGQIKSIDKNTWLIIAIIICAILVLAPDTGIGFDLFTGTINNGYIINNVFNRLNFLFNISTGIFAVTLITLLATAVLGKMTKRIAITSTIIIIITLIIIFLSFCALWKKYIW